MPEEDRFSFKKIFKEKFNKFALLTIEGLLINTLSLSIKEKS
jgi:hypothetical protein